MKNGLQKNVLIFLMVSLACLMVYYFHFILKQGVVFTHFFYIPIILSSLWWSLQFPAVGLFLGTVLIGSHLYNAPHETLTDDITRATMFVIVSMTVIYLKQRQEQAFDQVLAGEKRFRALFENLAEALCIFRTTDGGRDFLFTDVNKAAENIEKLPRIHFIGKTVTDCFPEIRRFGLLEIFERVWRTGTPETLPLSFYQDKRISGWRSYSVFRLSAEEIACVYKDETERKQAELNSIRLEDIVRYSNDAIIGLDVDGVIQTWNLGAELIFGYASEEVIGKHIYIYVPPDRQEEAARIIRKIFADERINRFETMRMRKDGRIIHVSITASAVKNCLGKIVGASLIIRDIHEKILLEQQLYHAQKRQAIGTLAGGIAHDFNNILSPIIGFSEITLEMLPSDSPLRDNLHQVLKSADRARELIRHILIFSRESPQERQSMKIQYTLKEVMKLIRATLPKTILIEQHIEDTGPILADATQIHQILMNLCTNAFHAMEAGGGTLGVFLSEVIIAPEDTLAYTTLEPGNFVRLSVSDTGCGMEKAVADKIFDPYFTTKDPGKGTGLGLSIVQGIVKSYGGEITVSSRPGEGTRFDIFFPRAMEKEAESEIALPTSMIGGREHVLVVDDEQAIILMLDYMLKSLGYRVTSATESLEALRLFTDNSVNIDLVITDQTMPNMTGFQLAQNIVRIKPGTPVILCTGFSENLSLEKCREMGICEYILKPIVKKELAQIVRRALDTPMNP